MSLKRSTGILAILVAGILVAGCREGEIPPDSGNGGGGQDAMTLVQFNPSPPAPVVAGTPATFRATVTRDGQPLPSILVNFSLNPSSGVGAFTLTSVTTSALGQADGILNTFAVPSTTSITITASTTTTTPALSRSLSITLGLP